MLEPVILPTFRALPQPYFNRIMCDQAWPAWTKDSSSITRLNCFPGWIAFRIFDRKHVVHGCSTIDPDYTPSCHTRSTFATCGSCLVCCTPRTQSESL
ncbi:hypothetical protein TNCV_3624581 [Trichonephila clavipes]|nr:hypothetical protein TNCV_3624581 [Trichonephila clavipes]